MSGHTACRARAWFTDTAPADCNLSCRGLCTRAHRARDFGYIGSELCPSAPATHRARAWGLGARARPVALDARGRRGCWRVALDGDDRATHCDIAARRVSLF